MRDAAPKLLGRAAGSIAAAIALLALTISPDASAQERRLRWNMASSYPGSTPQIGTLGVALTRKVERLSEGRFSIKFNEPGALVPALQVFDGVSAGSLDAGWSTPAFWVGRNSAFGIFTSVPFGPPPPEYLAWIFHGGGREIVAELYSRYNIVSLPCGLIPSEAGGWFKKEINSVEDLKGLKMRFGGIGARAIEKLGVTTQLLGTGEIFQALQLGTIDATELGYPSIDLNVGVHQVAKNYYFPGWHQPSGMLDLTMPKAKWDGLTDGQKAQLETACGDNFRDGIAEGEAAQAKALADIQAKGVTVRRFPDPVLAAFRRAWDEVVAEESGKNPDFKRAWDSLTAFRSSYKTWREANFVP